MKKKMTKRLLALVLALALCTALMLPGFAATAEEAECNHRYNTSTVQYYVSGNHREAGYHSESVFTRYTCAKCGYYYDVNTGRTVPVSHSRPCPTCGY